MKEMVQWQQWYIYSVLLAASVYNTTENGNPLKQLHGIRVRSLRSNEKKIAVAVRLPTSNTPQQMDDENKSHYTRLDTSRHPNHYLLFTYNFFFRSQSEVISFSFSNVLFMCVFLGLSRASHMPHCKWLHTGVVHQLAHNL